MAVSDHGNYSLAVDMSAMAFKTGLLGHIGEKLGTFPVAPFTLSIDSRRRLLTARAALDLRLPEVECPAGPAPRVVLTGTVSGAVTVETVDVGPPVALHPDDGQRSFFVNCPVRVTIPPQITKPGPGDTEKPSAIIGFGLASAEVGLDPGALDGCFPIQLRLTAAYLLGGQSSVIVRRNQIVTALQQALVREVEQQVRKIPALELVPGSDDLEPRAIVTTEASLRVLLTVKGHPHGNAALVMGPTVRPADPPRRSKPDAAAIVVSNAAVLRSVFRAVATTLGIPTASSQLGHPCLLFGSIPVSPSVLPIATPSGGPPIDVFLEALIGSVEADGIHVEMQLRGAFLDSSVTVHVFLVISLTASVSQTPQGFELTVGTGPATMTSAVVAATAGPLTIAAALFFAGGAATAFLLLMSPTAVAQALLVGSLAPGPPPGLGSPLAAGRVRLPVPLSLAAPANPVNSSQPEAPTVTVTLPGPPPVSIPAGRQNDIFIRLLL